MTIQIHAFDRKGLLKDVSTVFADEKVNVLELNTRTEAKDQSVHMEVRAEIESLEAMSKLLTKIDQLSNVFSARRRT